MRIRQYFSFTKRERMGVLTLVALLLIVAFLPHLIPGKKPLAEDIPIHIDKRTDSSGFKDYDSSRTRYYETYRRDNRHYNNENHGYGYYNQDSRYFNNYTGRHNENTYRKKYYSDSVYQKRGYYGDSKYQNNYSQRKSFAHSDEHKIFREYTGQYVAHHWPGYSPPIVDINTGDTAAFIALPGIGSKLAARIVSFREKLGGFYNVDQIREVYGLRDSVFMKLVPYLKCDSMFMRKPLASYSTSR